jgi:hypothetical protein
MVRSIGLLIAVLALFEFSAPASANGLLCGRGWHWSYVYFKCERNRHHCPAGKHWISIIKTCV